jgi:hypothetical protein
MRNVVKITTVYVIVATLFAGCGGGRKPPADNTPPPTLSSDTSLSNLTVSTGSLNEVFSSGTYAYTQDTGASELSVTPILSDANATVTVNGVAVASGSASDQIALALGSNSITVVTTAEDGSTTQTYTLDVSRLSNNASLSGLTLSAGDLDQIFQPGNDSYTGTAGFLISSTTVTATTADLNATISIDGAAGQFGVASDAKSLSEGNNPISIVVTAEDGVSTNTYTVDVIREAVDNFAQQAYIKASNPDGNDNFGSSVAFDGDTLVVGARHESSQATGVDGNQADDNRFKAGAVYVFTRDGANVWQQQAYLKASNSKVSDNFGVAVELDGDTLAVGAEHEGSLPTNCGPSDNPCVPGAGAVYIFTRDLAGIWSEQAYLKDSASTGFPKKFGTALSLEGNTLVVGAYHESNLATGVNADPEANIDQAYQSGAVYIFTRDASNSWSQEAYIKASNTGRLDAFGWSVSLFGDDLAVGARREYSSATGINGDQLNDDAESAGAVYLFQRDAGGTWSQQAYLKASNAERGDGFGQSVELAEDFLAVGAQGESSDAVGIDGDQFNNNASGTGAVYLFRRDAAGTWSQEAFVKPSNSTPNSGSFGTNIAFSGSTMIIGAMGEDSVQANSGAIYLFTRDAAGTWTEQAMIKAFIPELSDRFGEHIAISGDSVVVGAFGEDSDAVGIDGDQANNNTPQAGAVYVFQ